MHIKTYNGEVITLPLSLPESDSLLALPGLIDLHVHFRTPGQEYKENWASGAHAAIAGGVTTVVDMPNNSPAITTAELMHAKAALVNEQLQTANIPLRPYFYIGATPNNDAEIRAAAADTSVIGIKVFMGSSTGTLLVNKRDDQRRLFALSNELGLPLVLHAEDEALINDNKLRYPNPSLAQHSLIRSSAVAAKALEAALEMAAEFKNTIYVLHTSSADEVNLLREAKKCGITVFAETTPHHLFLTIDDYARLGTKAQMNPPLRSRRDQEALWGALQDGTLDTVATDHAPHTIEEKNKPYPDSPSGVPGVETMLPLLLNACHDGRLTIPRLMELTSTTPRRIFNLPATQDWVIIDTALTKTVTDAGLKTKCGWSPFSGLTLTGWPIATLIGERIFSLDV